MFYEEGRAFNMFVRCQGRCGVLVTLNLNICEKTPLLRPLLMSCVALWAMEASGIDRKGECVGKNVISRVAALNFVVF